MNAQEEHVNKSPCECHECTQARWKSSFQGQLASVLQQAPTPPWKSSFVDSDVTGDTKNFIDTGNGKRLWAKDADEIVRRHNQAVQQAPTEPTSVRAQLAIAATFSFLAWLFLILRSAR